jgi:DtxR family Mn-dependent transcriptional regulator
MLTIAEENYLKALYRLSGGPEKAVTTNALADQVRSTPASVTDMIKKLHEKKLVDHTKYKGAHLTTLGSKTALSIIRKHRIWEVFLVEKLHFSWDEIHEVAEDLEHIPSHVLIERLDAFLGFPEVDPHGDPIPSADGNIRPISAIPLLLSNGTGTWKVKAVTEDNPDFLRLLNRLGIALGTVIQVIEKNPYDESLLIALPIEGKEMVLSSKVANNLLVKSYSL